MFIYLTDIDKNNWEACVGLSVSDEQKAFVAPNYESILLAKFEENCYPMGIYRQDEMIGFLMYDIDPDTKRLELSRFMIDESHQGKGYGRQALTLLLEKVGKAQGPVDFYASVVPENEAMKKLISSMGFTETGEIMWDEEVFRIMLGPKADAAL